ncbi:MAG: PRC-barrel domain-containing protein [Dysgonamonadaceae bacterium]|nr:PRC-barrel domain-containing protein [Dysgonamonadaceae bacterium]
MLFKIKTLEKYKLKASDGEIGKVEDFYFDDKHWTIRYLVADTGTWLTERRVLIAPYAFNSVNKEEKEIAINLSKKQIEDSPSLDSDRPVSHQFEVAYYGYYGLPAYWHGGYMWGAYPYLNRDSKKSEEDKKREKTWDPHLRSTNDVKGHHIQASDGEIGHVDDFIIDDETWAIRYLIIDTKNWWAGKKILISPQWIDHISWDELKVFVNLSRENIMQSPEYSEDSLPTRDYESKLHSHYDRKGYWEDEPSAHEHPH